MTLETEDRERPQIGQGSELPTISASPSAFVNLAFHQNSIPILSDLAIELGESAEEIREAVLRLEADPPFLRTKTWTIDRLIPGSALRIPDLDIPLDQTLLAGLTEAYRARATLSLHHSDARLAEHSFEIRLLAPDEWGGLRSLPEILAAFVRPNDPAIETVLKKACDALHASGKPASIDGYQSGKLKENAMTDLTKLVKSPQFQQTAEAGPSANVYVSAKSGDVQALTEAGEIQLRMKPATSTTVAVTMSAG